MGKGRATQERERLRAQNLIYAPHTEMLLSLSGIKPGMSVIDIGCGIGDMTIQIARMVGPTGTVVGIDMDSDALDVAERQASGLRNVTFQQARIPDLELDHQADALVGRLVVMHLKDAAQDIEKLRSTVRPGGTIALLDFNVQRCRTLPHMPLTNQCVDWCIRALLAGGSNPAVGDQLYSILRAAGLNTPRLAVSVPTATASDLSALAVLAETVITLLPVIESFGLATREEIDPNTLIHRLQNEVLETGGIAFSPELVGAWATVPE
ncbi:class I SAM-dependent methyltransferase [Streptomyces sp. NPDC057717]|uniref:class I SAM-dependent methyltransferase n=1 Tax=Streptomyces sp. NPDC057717 TaxID=3346224 RepID=UPI0036B8146C